jgi:hypothetical protein
MRIVEQAFRVTARTSIMKTDHPADCIFQVFVKGRLQDRQSYKIDKEHINFGYDCLVPGDLVQLFYLLP